MLRKSQTKILWSLQGNSKSWRRGLSIGASHGKQKTWIEWLHLGEFCYNTTFHMSIGMSPFKALYGYDASNFIDHIFGDRRAPKAKDWIEECQEI